MADPTRTWPPRVDRRTSSAWVTAVGWVGAVFYLVNGLWAMAWPATFQRVVAPFDPLNVHYLRDAGAFSLGLGIALILGLTIERRALPTALLAGGIASVAHAASHIVDQAAGGRPILDIPSLGVLGLALLAAGWATAGRGRAP